MLVRIISDLHLEMSYYSIPRLETDPNTVLLLLGDVSSGITQLERYLDTCCEQFMYVIFVPGNHEYYQNVMPDHIEYFKEYSSSKRNLSYHVCGTTIIDKVRFICGTMWTDVEYGDEAAKNQLQQGMNDYYVIKNRTSSNKVARLTVDDTIGYYAEFMDYARSELATPFDGITVMCTHHSPSMSLITPEFHESLINSGFHSNSDHLMYKFPIDYWFYGHTHRHMDVVMHKTRVLTNPRGYNRGVSSEITGFDPELLLQLEKHEHNI